MALVALLQAPLCAQPPDYAIDFAYPEDTEANRFFFSKADTVSLRCTWEDAKGEQVLFDLPYPKTRDEAGVMAVLAHFADKKTSNAPKTIQSDPRFVLRLLDALAAWDAKRPFIGLVHDEHTDLWYHKDIETTEPKAEMGREVVVHIKGYLENGRVFDDSRKRGAPVKFVLGTNKHLPALEQAVTLFREGESGTVRLPADRAFGGRGAGNLIPPGSTIYYDVELLKVYD